MKEFISKVKRIPWWGILAGFGFFALQRGMYRLGDFVSRVTGTIDHAFACKIAAIDDLIPVVPVFTCYWHILLASCFLPLSQHLWTGWRKA